MIPHTNKGVSKRKGRLTLKTASDCESAARQRDENEKKKAGSLGKERRPLRLPWKDDVPRKGAEAGGRNIKEDIFSKKKGGEGDCLKRETKDRGLCLMGRPRLRHLSPGNKGRAKKRADPQVYLGGGRGIDTKGGRGRGD